MQANFYVDIRILDSTDDTELTLAHLRNQIYAVVHAVFRQMPAQFALALEVSPRQLRKMQAKELKYGIPPTVINYDVLRVFASEQHLLEELIDHIKGHWKVRDYAVLNHPTAVPHAKVTGLRSYFRFRIPTLKAERQLNHPTACESLHSRRLKESRKLPYFKVSSKSTGQNFTVPVQILDAEESGQGLPDSYGLARQSQPFALPVFEVN
ncbi:type I-F CRISPR-associated endoribonuclease Cas6/Csy4 [Acinetobacter rathckeae]|uniref:type I-F CRISPR-associated endoribonuclease Cas6/Csy4 n=1 Tax=Acinetobacter rathckeae TaxID=2605272 RepID=UPI0018A3291D|nr:type I-F CRISPR-associated endoribonuclease Cas6/Csy4 [Acinetobacter rathckeae]MBF7689129.1 type I-F CRISPR-associated endoribonuclease Cas6/Csy4 [Acinetobacter rathckeae]MBF7695429.1 type I-F CRISPR-associated endoribonuclease Cas6/Csy4 [Acinetobacter rathckeae]